MPKLEIARMRSSESRRLLETASWDEIARRLSLFARRRLGSRGTMEDAQDLAFEAIRRALDPDYADWDPGAQPSLLRHLGSVVNGLIQNRTRSRALALASARKPETLDVVGPSPEDGLSARQQTERALELLSSRLGADAVARSVLALTLDGIDKPRHQAERLGAPVGDIYNARRRLDGHIDAVRAQLRNEEPDVREV
jgi:DNA-directed RNA polymerase specialized sigma24 family protein